MALSVVLCGAIPLAGSANENSADSGHTASIMAVDQPHPVVDMAYGEFLFDFYQNRAFSALIHTLVSRHKQALPNNAAHVDVLSGPLYLRYGMLQEAERLFTDLLATTTSQERQHQIWFILAEIYYKKSQYQKSLSLMSEHIDYPSESLADKMELLAALNHLMLNNNERALNHLNNIQDVAQWGPYSLFNTAITYARLDQPEQAEHYFMRILRLTSDDPLLPVVKERAFLALGKQYLTYERWPEARRAFENIRLQSPVANHALLGLGWAYANSDDPMGALAPWLELRDRHQADPAVQEAYLNVPYVYEKLGALQSALNGYREAEQHFVLAHGMIEQTRAQVASDDWISALTPADPLAHNPMSPVEAFALPLSDASHYFYRFFASHRFNESYRRYRDLQNLWQNLADWRDRLPVYSEMAANNQQHLAGIAPFAAQTLDNAQALQAHSRTTLNRLNTQLGEAIARNDIRVTATDTEVALLQRLDDVGRKLAALPQTPGHDSLRERFRILRGVLDWDLQHQAIDRRWERRKDSAYISAQLDQIEERLQSTVAAYEHKQQQYAGFDQRITALDERLQALQSQTREQMAQQKGLLRAAANQLLDAHQQHLNDLQAYARLSIARLQDKAYVESTQREDLPAAPAQPAPRRPARPAAEAADSVDIEAIRRARESLFPTPLKDILPGD